MKICDRCKSKDAKEFYLKDGAFNTVIDVDLCSECVKGGRKIVRDFRKKFEDWLRGVESHE